MISDLNLLCFMNICVFLILSCKSIVTYYVLWSGNPEVTIIGTTPGDDRSLRSSCVHYVLMLWSGTLLKGGLKYPLVSNRTPLPREGRTKDVMQVLFHKHVWLYSEYMPTYWWTGASSMSPYVITVAWWMPSDIIIHHWSISYELHIDLC